MNHSDPYITRLIQIARAYYLEDQTQAEIARAFGISRSLVSRHLTAARKLGLVQIRISEPEESAGIIGQALRERYPHLRAVVVAPTFTQEADALRVVIGRAAANLFSSLIQPKQRVALGCGRTLRAMVEALPNRALPSITVVQAMGNLGHEAHQIDYNEITRRAADAIGGQPVYVSAPAILGARSGRAADLIAANPTLEYALSLARSAQLYVVGIGSMESDQVYVRSALIAQEEFEALRGRAVGDICGRFFDLDGREQPTAFQERIVGIELDDLRRAAFSVGVAGGADKAAPLLAAVRGGFINAVVSDEGTIQRMIELDDAKEDTREQTAAASR